jgi:putative ABC transport system permease protein
MFKNYLTIALRNLSRRRAYALLNIFGLAIGVTCCLIIFQYVSYEKSYDKFNSVAKDIVRIRLDSYQQGNLAYQSATSYPAIGPTAKRELPDVEDYCRLYNVQQLLVNEQKNVKFNELKGYYADPSAINMLGLNMVKGNPGEVLNSVNKMIVSKSFARKYFGDSNPIGKTLVSKDQQLAESYMITGVFKDYPPNSHLVVDYIISYATFGKIRRLQGDTQNSTETGWGWYDFYTYLKLKPGTDLKKFDVRLSSFCDAHINSLGKNKGNHVRAELHVIPLTDIHLYSNANQEAEVNGNGQVVSFLFLVGIFIILIAWINYVNLATARSVERAKEVGVRKVLGAGRSALVRQFLAESFMLNFIALTIAFFAAYLLTPSFNRFIGREIVMGFTLPWTYLTEFLVLFLAGSFFSGIYPAFILSGYQPVKVLKGNFKNTSSGIKLRKALITGQFITSVVLVAGTIIVYQQVSFMRGQKLGANINQTLVIKGAASLRDTVYSKVFQPFKQDALNITNVKNVTASSNVMGQEIYWTRGVKRLAANSTEVTLYNLGVDYDFIPSFGIEIKAGRNFSKDFATDKKTALLNEDAAKLLGFKDAKSAINQKIWPYDTLTIIGVVANFHQEGLKKSVQPMIVLLRPNSRDYYSVKVGTNNISATVADIKNVWDRYFPSDPFNYSFLDESFNRQYKSDELFGSIFTMFALLAILIACFGLAGLSAYNILQRRKEIGIRKVIGASVQQLLALLVTDFLRLGIIAFFISIPITWLLMNQWLQDFAYRIHISWLVFAVAGFVITLIVLATISFQAIKAATANPIKSLRTE